MRWWLAAIVLLGVPAAALAQAGGVVVQLYGGMIAFPGEADVNPGGAFGVNVDLEPVGPLQVELGYQGAAYTETSPVPGQQDIAALENGGYGAVKLSPVPGGVRPYALAGLGVSHINAVEPEPTGALQDDTVAKVPLGVGVDVDVGLFAMGVRGTWGLLFGNQDALQTESARGADQLSGTMHLGATF